LAVDVALVVAVAVAVAVTVTVGWEGLQVVVPVIGSSVDNFTSVRDVTSVCSVGFVQTGVRLLWLSELGVRISA
jgi:hypothetical protein